MRCLSIMKELLSDQLLHKFELWFFLLNNLPMCESQKSLFFASLRINVVFVEYELTDYTAALSEHYKKFIYRKSSENT